jgi:hypothetical protein
MKLISPETIYDRVFGRIGKGHEGRIERLEKLATSANLPWGFLEATFVSIASGTSLTNVDFTLTNLNNSGGTSGDSDITIGDVGGRTGLILSTVGTYLVFYALTANIIGAGAAGSIAEFTSPTGLSGDALAGGVIAPFYVPLGQSNGTAQPAVATWENLNGTVDPVPRSISMQAGQNSGATATCRCSIAAVKISAKANPAFT